MINGFVKLDRNIVNWEWYTDLPTKCLFFHLILKANWKDGRFMGYDVPRGSFITSIQHLADEASLTTKQVRTALAKLESTGEITKKSTNKFTIIKIVNYNKFQNNGNQRASTEPDDNEVFGGFEMSAGQSKGNQRANKRQTEGKQRATIEEYKEYKEDKNYNNHTANADSGSGCGDITFVFNAAFGRSPNPTEQKTVNLLVDKYGSGWVEEALTMTAEAGKDLRYAKGILCNWEERGKDAKKKQDVKKQLESERQNETDYNDIYNIYN